MERDDAMRELEETTPEEGRELAIKMFQEVIEKLKLGKFKAIFALGINDDDTAYLAGFGDPEVVPELFDICKDEFNFIKGLN